MKNIMKNRDVDHFEIELAAPGLPQSDLQLKMIRRKFVRLSFRRHFELAELVNQTSG